MKKLLLYFVLAGFTVFAMSMKFSVNTTGMKKDVSVNYSDTTKKAVSDKSKTCAKKCDPSACQKKCDPAKCQKKCDPAKCCKGKAEGKKCCASKNAENTSGTCHKKIRKE